MKRAYRARSVCALCYRPLGACAQHTRTPPTAAHTPHLIADAVLDASPPGPLGVLSCRGVGVGQDAHKPRTDAPELFRDVLPHLYCVFGFVCDVRRAMREGGCFRVSGERWHVSLFARAGHRIKNTGMHTKLLLLLAMRHFCKVWYGMCEIDTGPPFSSASFSRSFQSSLGGFVRDHLSLQLAFQGSSPGGMIIPTAV